MKLLANFLDVLYKITDRILMYIYRTSFSKIGVNVIFSPLNSSFTYENISIGDNVSIGYRASFIAKISHIYIGCNVAIAPNVTIRGGNHRFDIVGKFITDYKESDKKRNDDEPVFIEDDCWIGTNATILKVVTISRGSIVAAGSLVNKSCPPYAIIGGVPAKILKFRWSCVENIMKHEETLYPENMRLSKLFLEEMFKKYGK